MWVRLKERHDIFGRSNKFDLQREDCVTVLFESQQTGIVEICALDVYLEDDEVWVDMSDAFMKNLLVHDREHTRFREAETDGERDRGLFD